MNRAARPCSLLYGSLLYVALVICFDLLIYKLLLLITLSVLDCFYNDISGMNPHGIECNTIF